jgi:hypothetical protein
MYEFITRNSRLRNGHYFTNQNDGKLKNNALITTPTTPTTNRNHNDQQKSV